MAAESIRYLVSRTIDSSITGNDLGRFGGMGARTWAAFGNFLRIAALANFLGSAVAAYLAVEFAQAQAQASHVLLAAVLAIVCLVVATLFWMAKGPLVSGNFVVRLLVALYMLSWIISTLGFGSLVILIVYLFTGEPDSYSGRFARPTPPKPRFTPPRNWGASGRVGPSGAMLYSDADKGASVGIFESGIQVQVMDKRNGFAEVVAASGERGWIDLRTLAEGV